MHEMPVVEPLDHRERSVAERIHAVQFAAYTQEAQLLGVSEFPPLQRTVADVEASNEQFFGAYLDGALVGVIAVEPGEATGMFQISSLAVAPASQRRGVGRALLGAVVSRSQELVVSTGTANKPALSLYEQFGFVELRRRFVGTLEIVYLHRAQAESTSSGERA